MRLPSFKPLSLFSGHIAEVLSANRKLFFSSSSVKAATNE